MPGAMFWVPLSQGFRHISLMLWDLDVFIPLTMPLFSLLDCVWISFLEQTKWLKTTEVYSLRVLEATSQNQRLSRTASSGVSSEESLTSPLPFSGGCKCPGLLLPGRVQCFCLYMAFPSVPLVFSPLISYKKKKKKNPKVDLGPI